MTDITISLVVATIVVGFFSAVVAPKIIPHVSMDTIDTPAVSKKAA